MIVTFQSTIGHTIFDGINLLIGQIEREGRCELELMCVELCVAGILMSLVLFVVDVVEQEIAVGNDVAHVLCLLGILQLQSIDDFLGSSLDGLHILRVLTFRFEGNLS